MYDLIIFVVIRAGTQAAVGLSKDDLAKRMKVKPTMYILYLYY